VSNDLLPPNATPQERALSETIARVSDVPVLVRESWNPDTCPAELLPWLAWAFSVDEWDTTWSEQEKRDVIKASVEVHRHKGTIGAIDRALKPLGYLIEVVEWWETDPPGAPYTFSIIMGTGSKPVSEELYEKAERIVLQYKNLRSQLQALTVKADVRGTVYAGAATIDGQDTTVYPYAVSELDSAAILYFASCTQDVTEASIYPLGWVPEEQIARVVATGEFRVTTSGHLRTTQGA
jgi:phage tail P2-like protein